MECMEIVIALTNFCDTNTSTNNNLEDQRANGFEARGFEDPKKMKEPMNPNATNPLWRFTRSVITVTGAVLLLCHPAYAQTIPNPSFETDTFTAFPGNISVSGNGPITGWTGTSTDRVGLNPAGGSPFADNGTKPDGNNVAFLQANTTDPGVPATLSTTISGLTPGTTYRVTFRANARNGNTPNVKIYIDNVGVLVPGGPDGFSTAAVGAPNPYWYVGFDFMAGAASKRWQS